MVKKSKKFLFFLAVILIGWFAAVGQKTEAQNYNLAPNASSPSTFTLTWSADTFVPADYEGKALPTQGSQIRVAAVPVKKLSPDPQRYYYRWLIDGDVAGWANGQGKSVLKFSAQKWPGQTYEIEVQILDQNENLVSKDRVSIAVVEPELIVLGKNSFYALDKISAASAGQSIDFLAQPFFFSIKKVSEAVWDWNFAGQSLASSSQKDPNLLTLNIPDNSSGSSVTKNIAVTVQNLNNGGQQKSTSFDIVIR